jgi:hypothetical protein
MIVQSKNEDDAADYVDHVWEMWLSLGPRENPETGEQEDFSHLRNGVRTIKPKQTGIRPYLDIEWEHPDGRVSMLNAMASTAGAGHGRTAYRVSLDEFSRHPYAREAFKATIPTQAGSKKASGKTNLISTGERRLERAGRVRQLLPPRLDHRRGERDQQRSFSAGT